VVSASNEVSISRSASDVYQFLLDGQNNQKWRSGVLSISLKSGQAGEIGAVYAQKLKGPGGRVIDGDYKITEATRDKTLAFEVIAGPARPTGRYELSPVGSGTKLSFSLQFEPAGLMKLMSGMIKKTMVVEVEALSELKKVLEQG
jgi:carbon monoxide dehydrogenase subunit G